MPDTAKLFTTGRSQAVRLPKAFRFEGKEVSIRRDEQTGDVILSARTPSWTEFFALADKTLVPDDFMTGSDRPQDVPSRDPFADFAE